MEKEEEEARERVVRLTDENHRRIHPGIRPNYTGEYGGLAAVYRKQGLSEKQIAKRIISNATRAIEGEKVLDECNKKGNT